MNKSRLLGAVCAAAFSFASMSANAALVSRMGGQAYWDDVLDVTWLADANYAETSGFHDNNLLSWYEANDFIAELNNTSHLGINTWRLPSMDVNGDASIVACSFATEIECRDNELGYMSVEYGAGPENPLGFDNVFYNYWSSTDYDAANVNYPDGYPCNAGAEGLCAWRQAIGLDNQNYVRKSFGEGGDRGYSVWAVASGDVLAPITTLSIVIPEGTPQECVNAGSSTINMEAWVTLPNGDAIDTVSWKLDGSPVNVFGEFVNILVPLGTHTVEATVTTILLLSATDSTTISVEDTVAPTISAGFINAKTGAVITSIKNKDKAIPSYSVVDACDADPTIVSATVGTSAENVDQVSASVSKKDSSVKLSIEGNPDSAELSVTAEDAFGNMSSEKAVLTIIP